MWEVPSRHGHNVAADIDPGNGRAAEWHSAPGTATMEPKWEECAMQVTLERWGPDDLDVLRRANTPGMTRFLGGPESDEALAQRHADYLALWDSGEVRMFRVDVDGAAAGYAGWWAEEHDGAPVYEIGCVVEPGWQGRGVASAALGEVVRRALGTEDLRPVVGYANVENVASNALCNRLGFTLVGTAAFPDEDGEAVMPVNVWMIQPSGVA